MHNGATWLIHLNVNQFFQKKSKKELKHQNIVTIWSILLCFRFIFWSNFRISELARVAPIYTTFKHNKTKLLTFSQKNSLTGFWMHPYHSFICCLCTLDAWKSSEYDSAVLLYVSKNLLLKTERARVTAVYTSIYHKKVSESIVKLHRS